ncbi:MAG: sulfatase-like hydrolase/transferase [Candidatus Nanohaloarchaea archaeon]
MRYILIISIILFVLLGGVIHLGSQSQPSNVVVITIESTRADHLGPCYGYTRRTSPNICDLASDGVLFKNAYSQGSSTDRSVPPMLTGMTPSRVSYKNFNQTLPSSLPTIHGVLAKRGFRSFKSPHLSFDVNNESFISNRRIRDIDFNDEPIYAWKFFRSPSPHRPYSPRKKYQRWNDPIPPPLLKNLTSPHVQLPVESNLSKSTIIALYDGSIRSVDSRIGDIISHLKEESVYQESMIIVTSDHGEKFGEHGRFGRHGGLPYNNVIHVPLVIKYPGNTYAGTVINGPVAISSIPSTVYDTLNLSDAPDTFFDSLNKVIINDSNYSSPVVSVGRPLQSWSYQEDKFKYLLKNAQAVCTSSKYTPSQELYRLSNNREELIDVSGQYPRKVEEMQNETCEVFLHGLASREIRRKNLSVRQKQNLRDLGYLQ